MIPLLCESIIDCSAVIGDLPCLQLNEPPPSPSIFPVRGVRVLFIDDRLIALDKPAGLLSVPGIGPQNQDCLARRVDFAFPGALIVHRLDAETSGVIVMARDPQAHRELGRQFEQRKTAKTYIAIVAGQVREAQGEIDLPMRKDIDNRPRSIIDHVHGKRSATRWRVLERDGHADSTRLELTPITGRSHQIRVHLAAIGHAILGDSLYAPRELRFAARRLLLHSLRLQISHPTTREAIQFEAACPF